MTAASSAQAAAATARAATDAPLCAATESRSAAGEAARAPPRNGALRPRPLPRVMSSVAGITASLGEIGAAPRRCQARSRLAAIPVAELTDECGAANRPSAPEFRNAIPESRGTAGAAPGSWGPVIGGVDSAFNREVRRPAFQQAPRGPIPWHQQHWATWPSRRPDRRSSSCQSQRSWRESEAHQRVTPSPDQGLDPVGGWLQSCRREVDTRRDAYNSAEWPQMAEVWENEMNSRNGGVGIIGVIVIVVVILFLVGVIKL